MKDFNFQSLHFNIEPMTINIIPRMFQYVSVRATPGNYGKLISSIESSWKKVNPTVPFEYYFYDDEFDKLYKADQKSGTMLNYFTFFAILIACLGLFGLASFTIERRTKEIGIRKVLGAEYGGLAFILTKDFLKLILISNAIALPVAYYLSNRWMQGFAYASDINLGLFVMTTLSTIFIAVITVSFHVNRATSMNPVDTLKTE